MSVNFVKRCAIDEVLAARLSSELGVPIDMARLLISRGVSDKASAEEFLNPSVDYLSNPFEIKGMAEAIERIKQAVNADESVVIYGDYDCDGICAISILYNYLKDYIKNLNYYVPNRHKEGYGLHNISIDSVMASYKPNLIITVDCGINSASEVEYIKACGADVIVTDHHEPQAVLPNCIIVNPKVEKKGFYDYCGAGVAFKLVEALAGREKALEFIGLAAVATIADIVPLVEENRIIAKVGLDRINENKTLAAVMLKKTARHREGDRL
jgi:Single-stranded DNA-specific exonuclease